MPKPNLVKRPTTSPFKFQKAGGKLNSDKWVVVDKRGGILTLPLTETEANEAMSYFLRGYNAALDDLDAEEIAKQKTPAEDRAPDVPTNPLDRFGPMEG